MYFVCVFRLNKTVECKCDVQSYQLLYFDWTYFGCSHRSVCAAEGHICAVESSDSQICVVFCLKILCYSEHVPFYGRT